MTIMFELFQICQKNIPVGIQFLFFIVVLLCAVTNQSVLLTKLYIKKKQQKNKISLWHYIYTIIYTVINLLYILFCIYVIFIIFLFF